MTVIGDLPVSLETDEILRRQGIRPASARASRFRDMSRELLALVGEEGLLTPQLAYEQYPLNHVRKGLLQVGSTAVRGERITSLLASAQAAVVAICTIGPRLEAKVQCFFKANETTKALLLDGIGSAAVDAVARKSCHFLRDIATSKGHTASSALSPGTEGFPLSEQSSLFELVDADRIGVRLTSSGMMEPRKSLSMLVGFGPDMPTWTQAEVCAQCGVREMCRYRTRLGAS